MRVFIILKNTSGEAEIETHFTHSYQDTMLLVTRGLYPVTFFKNKELTELKLWGATEEAFNANTFHLEDALNGIEDNFTCYPVKAPFPDVSTKEIMCMGNYPIVANCLTYTSVLGHCSRCEINYDLTINIPNDST
jgi:hypothetical protein